jgi:Carboxypeptidase regulatory-like domain
MLRTRLVSHVYWFLFVCVLMQEAATAQDISAPAPHTATIVGTAMDTNGGSIPNASVLLQGIAPDDRYTAQTNDNGFFQIAGVNAGASYRLTVTAKGFADWSLPSVTLTPGQYMEVTGITLAVTDNITVRAVVSSEAIATQEVNEETKQRAFGVLPMFYAVYDPNPVPLSPKLKFKLAFRTATDPFSIGADFFLAGVHQANDSPRYGGGIQGYAQRAGADFASGSTDIMIGGAVLPTLLHQDPRYFYKGTGSTTSRVLHALSGPLIARGDNGRWQPNFSSVGGDLASGAIANTYYPARNRGTSVVFGIALVDCAGTMVADVIQEFIPRNMGAKEKGQ